MKKTIRLSESDLHRVIKESVKRILMENANINDVILLLAQTYGTDPSSIKQENENIYNVQINGQYHDVYVFNNEQEARDYLWNNWGLEDYCEGAADEEYWRKRCPEYFNENGEADWSGIAQKVLDTEGPGWFIDGYDGMGTELPNGMIAYRYD